MELTDVLARILGRHRLLVIAFVLFGIGGALAMHWSDKPSYRGTARLLVTSSDPTTSSQAVAIADTIRALATGPALVGRALATIHVHRDAATVAANNVKVHGLGSSGVVALQVTDRDPSVALQLTNAIGQAVVDQRTDAAAKSIRTDILALQNQINAVQREISGVDRQLSAVNQRAGSADTSVANRAIAQRDQLLAQRVALTDQVTALTSSKAELSGQLALRPPAAMVDTAQGPATRLTPHRLPDLGLGALLGLVLAVALAAALETIRPTVVGRAAIARSLQTPVLGEVRRSVSGWNREDVLETASHIGLAAAGAAVSRLDLMSTSSQVDLPRLAKAVGNELTHLRVEVADPGTIVARVVSGNDPDGIPRASRNRRPAPNRGLVLVVPEATKLADLEPARDFLAISGWPLLGVIIAQRGNPLAIVRREPPTTDTPTTDTMQSEASA
jgi:capsular polysaccharide biosynthesis protein